MCPWVTSLACGAADIDFIFWTDLSLCSRIFEIFSILPFLGFCFDRITLFISTSSAPSEFWSLGLFNVDGAPERTISFSRFALVALLVVVLARGTTADGEDTDVCPPD